MPAGSIEVEADQGAPCRRWRKQFPTLDPKAILFAVAVFPAEAFRDVGGILQAMGFFAATIVPAALAWVGFGPTLSGPRARLRPVLVQRGAALVLLTFSASLGATALS